MNPLYLTNIGIPENLTVTCDLESATRDREVLVFAAPSQATRHVAEATLPFVDPSQILVSVAKGIENNTLKTTTRVLAEAFPLVPEENIGVLYGPSHAEEVAIGIPTAVVSAAGSEETATTIQSIFMTPAFRVYVNSDLIGVEIAGSVKNVMAIAAGISDGVGFGDNTKAGLITRGMAEIRRLGVALGAVPSTFAGLAGIGDLVVTCMSRYSRNRHLGEEIGKGFSLEEVERRTSMVAEGVRTTVSTLQIAERNGIEMPITTAVHSILFEGKRPLDAVSDLMSRAARKEDWLSETD